jgi:hypothetical protein
MKNSRKNSLFLGMNIIAAALVIYNLGSLFGCNASNPQKTLEPRQLFMENKKRPCQIGSVKKLIFPLTFHLPLKLISSISLPKWNFGKNATGFYFGFPMALLKSASKKRIMEFTLSKWLKRGTMEKGISVD